GAPHQRPRRGADLRGVGGGGGGGVGIRGVPGEAPRPEPVGVAGRHRAGRDGRPVRGAAGDRGGPAGGGEAAVRLGRGRVAGGPPGPNPIITPPDRAPRRSTGHRAPMLQPFAAVPGRLYVVATLLPLAAFVLLLVAGGARNLCRPYRHGRGTAASVYWLLGGDKPLKTGAYFATIFMAIAAAFAVAGLVLFLTDTSTGAERAARWGERTDWVRI